MLCPSCEFENESGLKFCNGCGTPLRVLCPQCGFENQPRSRFCGDCGTSLTGQAPTPNSSLTGTEHGQPEAQPTPVKFPSTEPHTPDAERRQLTVIFVDLIGSTSLSGELDPEDLREVIKAYQATCTDVITRYDGHVAQLLGDGLLVYFGYPQAHEDDAQRAIHTGLGIVKAIGDLNTRLEKDKGIGLAVRLGIHTGLVVVGEMGGEGRQEQLALGETPNVAARIQGLAEPDTVVISDATYRLIQGYFDCETLGERELRGVAEPIVVYQVLQESGAESRLDIASIRGLTPLVGREQEVGLLLERWEQARDGQGQVVLLSGEAGIGKSRLVQVLKDSVVDETHTRLECRSSPYYQNTALYPITHLLQRVLNWKPDDTSGEKLAKLEQALGEYRLPLEETVPLFGILLSLPVPEDRYLPLNLSPQRQRQKTLENVVAILLEEAERQPVLFILEDAHWLDASTLELLALLIDQVPTSQVLILLTYRSEFQPTWSHRSYLTQLTLNRLSGNQIVRLAEQVSGGKGLPDEIVQQLIEKTDGVPLYVEEMTKSVLESGILKETDGHYELTGSLSSLSIPATLQDSLMARLDRLVTAKAVAQYASVIGRQFSYELLQEVSQVDTETLLKELSRLVEAELIYQRGLPPQATYTFKHALVQDTAYESLLRSTRQTYHRRIAEVLSERFQEGAEIQPELLAHHYTQAGLNEPAIGYWQQAGERASDRWAYPEAISHLKTGLALLQTLPEALERHQLELPLQIALGRILRIPKGFTAPEVAEVFTRARVLCEQLRDTQDVSPVLYGLWRFYQLKADFPLARQLGEELLSLAERRDDSSVYILSHYTLGSSCLWGGELQLAHTHLEESLAHYSRSQRRDPMFGTRQDLPRISLRVHTAVTLWLLGYPDQALTRVRDALALATELGIPYGRAVALSVASMVYQFYGEGQDVYDHAKAAVTLSTEPEFPIWLTFSTILRGWALMNLGQGKEGLTQMRQGLTDYGIAGAELYTTYFLSLIAEVSGRLKQVTEGLDTLKEGLEVMERKGERWYESELHRLNGQLLLQQSPDNFLEAESYFQRALEVSRYQESKSLELRAATSMAQLWQNQGKSDEARDLLAPVYSWFTEGFDTADLIDAKGLLDELEEAR